MPVKSISRVITVFFIITVLLVLCLHVLNDLFTFSSNTFNGLFGLINSIIGGFIAGLITYAGVLLTLKKQDRDKFKDTFALKIAVIDQFLRTLNTLILRMDKSINKIDQIEHIYYNLDLIKEHTEDAFKHLGGDVGVNMYILNNDLSTLQTDFGIFSNIDEEDEQLNDVINELVEKYPPLLVHMKNQLDDYLRNIAEEAKLHKLNM